MTQRIRCRTGWCGLALLLAAACSDSVTPRLGTAADQELAEEALPRGEHLWVFHISGGQYAAHIQLVVIGDPASRHRKRLFRPIASRAWDGTPTNDFGGLRATRDDRTGLRWTLRDPSGGTVRLSYTITGDTATGGLTLPDG